MTDMREVLARLEGLAREWEAEAARARLRADTPSGPLASGIVIGATLDACAERLRQIKEDIVNG